MNAIAPPPRKGPLPVWSIRPESRSRGGGSRRGKGLSGYVRICEFETSFNVAWRWRNETKWYSGTVETREEAEALRKRIKESLERGEDPGEMPKRVRTREVTSVERSADEIAQARARLQQQLAPGAERCPHCHCLKPCDPCIDEIRRILRSARRGAP